MAKSNGAPLSARIADVAGLMASLVVAPLASLIARLGPARLPTTYKFWDSLGVSPMRHHYYQPIPRLEELPEQTWECDPLYGIDLNVDAQLALLGELNYQTELSELPIGNPGYEGSYFYNNSNFGSGDGEIYYSVIRKFRPKRIVEIGGGYSTLIGRRAVDANGGGTEHVCVEPYEQPWLDKIGLSQIIRSKVETLPLELFTQLGEDDVLFIDSSHVLRTGGDVWYEYLRILPALRRGVLVHIHDIFLPYPYPREWLAVRRLYWTEQYLLQAILQDNDTFDVLLALHYLSQAYKPDLARACPIFAAQPDRKPGSFWIRKR